MDSKLKDLDEEILQEAINVEARRPSRKRARNPKPISAKRLKNEWGLVTAVLNKYQKELNFEKIELPQVMERIVELPSAADVLRIINGTDIELPGTPGGVALFFHVGGPRTDEIKIHQRELYNYP